MKKFPADFMWGTATSAYQVEGNNTNNDWWVWEAAGNNTPSGKACDQYNRFREDFQIAAGLKHNTHRFSMEWSRLEKNENQWDKKEWDHYEKVVDELLKHGIEPIVTLNHFTLPLWLAKKGGWENEYTVEKFTEYARRSIKRLGEKVNYWITINEPLILARLAYKDGAWPPCKKDDHTYNVVADNLLKAHIRACKRMKEIAVVSKHINSPVIGLAKAVTAFHPCSEKCFKDKIAAFLTSRYWNHSFIRKAIHKGAVDFIGLNYYFREFVHHGEKFQKNPGGYICTHLHHEKAGKRTKKGWEIYPRGLYEVVKSFSKYRLPIMITENGLSTDDDSVRREFIKDHLTFLLKAIHEGAPVTGYLHWSLIDNFEWDGGYDHKFGLVGVDFKTQKREIRDSARYLTEVIHHQKP